MIETETLLTFDNRLIAHFGPALDEPQWAPWENSKFPFLCAYIPFWVMVSHQFLIVSHRVSHLGTHPNRD